MSGRSTLLFCAVLFAAASPAPAQWMSGGNPLTTTPDADGRAFTVSDGGTGMIAVWAQSDGGDVELVAQRVDEFGVMLWGPTGIPVCQAAELRAITSIIPDGSGGCVIAWTDYRSGEADVYVQWLDASGVPQFMADGLPAAGVLTSIERNAGLVMLSSTTFAVGYEVDAGLIVTDIYAQAIDNSGTSLWGAGGVAVCSATGVQTGLDVATDGSGGIFLVWQDFRGVTWDIYAQRVDGSGTPLWTADGVAVVDTGGDQVEPFIVSGGGGSAIVGWRSDGFGDTIVASRLDAAGATAWAMVVASSPLAERRFPRAVPDGQGGAILAWIDDRDGHNGVWAMRVTAAGATTGWPADGLEVFSYPAGAADHVVVPDREGGALIAARAESFPTGYLSQVTNDGQLPWVDGTDDFPTPVADGCGRITMSAIYVGASVNEPLALRLETTYQTYGHPETTFISVTDRPNDSGGYMRLEFEPSDLAASLGFQYQAYLAPSPTGPWTAGGGYTASAGETSPIVFYHTSLGDSIPTWVRIHAREFLNNHVFISKPDSTVTIDNAPAAPGQMQAEQIGNYVYLSWIPPDPVAPDFLQYHVYRAAILTPGAVSNPSPQTLEWIEIGTTTSESFVDKDVDPSFDWVWAATAADSAGNESALAESDSVTGIATGIGDTPSFVSLSPNYPNPFTRSTTLRFSLAETTPVRIEVFDVAGRRVREQHLGRLSPGHHRVPFESVGPGRGPLPSGVYFYRVHAGRHVQTRKMVIRH